MGMPLSIDTNTSVPDSSGASQYGLTQSPSTVVSIGGSEDVAALVNAVANSQLAVTNGSRLNVINSQTGSTLGGVGDITAGVSTPVGSVSVDSSINWTYILVGGLAIGFFIWYSHRK